MSGVRRCGVWLVPKKLDLHRYHSSGIWEYDGYSFTQTFFSSTVPDTLMAVLLHFRNDDGKR